MTICKNEENFIYLMMQNIAPIADEFVIVDTGSDDGTIAEIERFKKHYRNPVRIFHKKFTSRKPFRSFHMFKFIFFNHAANPSSTIFHFNNFPILPLYYFQKQHNVKDGYFFRSATLFLCHRKNNLY